MTIEGVEGGVDGTYRLLKNILGLWLVQRCKHSFEAADKPASSSPATKARYRFWKCSEKAAGGCRSNNFLQLSAQARPTLE
jgi:hypothetical protein